MLNTPLAQVSTLMAAGVSAWAMLRGGWPERLAGVGVALDWAGTVLFQDRRHGHHAQPAIFILDLALTAVLLAIVLRTKRTWVLWAAACSVLLILTHVTLMIDTTFGQWTFLTASYIWSFGILVALAVGTGVEAPRLARLVQR